MGGWFWFGFFCVGVMSEQLWIIFIWVLWILFGRFGFIVIVIARLILILLCFVNLIVSIVYIGIKILLFIFESILHSFKAIQIRFSK